MHGIIILGLVRDHLIITIKNNLYISMKHYFFLLLLLSLFILPTPGLAAIPTFSTSESAANVVVGTNDQTAQTSTTTANVSEVKASRTLTVGALPANAETITIGTCIVTFTTIASTTTHDTNCTGGASIDRTATTTDTLLTVTEIATQLLALTNVSDTGHGALAVAASSTSATSAVFTTSGTETSATVVTFTDGTTGDITSTNSRTGVIPVVQINTLSIGGTVDAGDVFTATLPTVGAVTYTVTSSDTTTTHIANGLGTAITASTGYSSQAFTIATSTSNIVFTAKVAGTGFTQTSSAANRAAVAQVVVFTSENLGDDYVYTITINGTDYSYTHQDDDTTQQVIEAMKALVDANGAVSCTEDDESITCTADTPGTAFTYSTGVAEVGGSSSGGRSSGGGSSKKSVVAPQVVTVVTPQATTAVEPGCLPGYIFSVQTGKTCGISTTFSSQGGVSTIARTLSFGQNGADVSLVQRLLSQDATVYPEAVVTGYFGPLTRSAVQRFQLKHSITSEGVPGYGWVGPRTKAKLAELYGM
jgi:hypothetical protein